MIFAIHGATRSETLAKLHVNDVTEQGEVILIKLPETKRNFVRSFIVENDEYLAYVRKYKELRPANIPHSRFFVNYQNGKCTTQPIGRNKFLNTPKNVARFSSLKGAENYQLHSFNCAPLKRKRYRGRGPPRVLRGSTGESISKKRKIDESISKQINDTEAVDTSTSSTTTPKSNSIATSPLPEKSKARYLKEYNSFMKWKSKKRIDKTDVSEETLLAYLEHLSSM